MINKDVTTVESSCYIIRKEILQHYSENFYTFYKQPQNPHRDTKY